MASGLNQRSKLQNKITFRKKGKQNLKKGNQTNGDSQKKGSSTGPVFPENSGPESVFTSFQPTLHRKPFEDKSRMPLSSEEYEDDDFEIDGE
jgi:hypothetical protein